MTMCAHWRVTKKKPSASSRDFGHDRSREPCAFVPSIALVGADGVLARNYSLLEGDAHVLLNVAPLLTDDLALLGEAGKITAVSTYRFARVAANDGAVELSLRGKQNERVAFNYPRQKTGLAIEKQVGWGTRTLLDCFFFPSLKSNSRIISFHHTSAPPASSGFFFFEERVSLFLKPMRAHTRNLGSCVRTFTVHLLTHSFETCFRGHRRLLFAVRNATGLFECAALDAIIARGRVFGTHSRLSFLLFTVIFLCPTTE